MREIYGLMYRNSNDYAMAAVMVVNEGDWRVYIGGCPVELREAEAYEWVARYGTKLSMPFNASLVVGLLKNGRIEMPVLPYGN